MDDKAHTLMLRIFKDIPDPRMQGKVIHNLHDILVIAVCSIIVGLEHWTQMEDYGKANFDWFKSFLDLPRGIPSHDTFGNVFAALSPDEFEKSIQRWLRSLSGAGTAGKHIAIDGMALEEVLRKNKYHDDVVLAVPGAGVFKTEWVKHFRGKDVFLCYDNDDAGKKGIIKAADKLNGIAKSVQILKWPANKGDGYDVRDFYLDNLKKNLKSKAILLRFKKLFKPFDELSQYLPDTTKPPNQPILTNLSDVESEEITWLWNNRIPCGKFSVIAGDPGLGKSFLTLYIAAQVTMGREWPDCDEPPEKGAVILLSAEDGLADTIRPRLDAADADVSLIVALEGVSTDNGNGEKEFDLSKDLASLEEAVKKTKNVRLIIIHPITAYLGNTDSHNNTNVRGVLAPLSKLAEKYNAAIVAVTHLNKKDGDKAIYRIMGSLAFAAAARAVWMVTRDKDNGNQRQFIPNKNNLSINPTGLTFAIEDGAVVFIGEPFEVESPDEITNPGSKMDDACNFLKDKLENGPVLSATLKAMAKNAGISDSTLKRAIETLRIVRNKEAGTKFGQWFSELPPPDE